MRELATKLLQHEYNGDPAGLTDVYVSENGGMYSQRCYILNHGEDSYQVRLLRIDSERFGTLEEALTTVMEVIRNDR